MRVLKLKLLSQHNSAVIFNVKITATMMQTHHNIKLSKSALSRIIISMIVWRGIFGKSYLNTCYTARPCPSGESIARSCITCEIWVALKLRVPLLSSPSLSFSKNQAEKRSDTIKKRPL